MSGAEAACSVLGSPAGWRNQSALANFHELRQGFIPTEILAAKRADPQADTSGLESEIDGLVAPRQLYGLTEEEIRIVEGKA